MTAAEVTRTFSEVLDRVAAGEEIEVTRNGAAIATIRPPNARLVSPERFRALVASAPPPDEAFAGDVRAARDAVGPPGDVWPS